MKLLVGIILTIQLVTGTPNMAHAEKGAPRVCGGYELPEQGPALVSCVFTRLGIPEQIATARYVANRESHYVPTAYNPSGCAGIYQHMLRYWRGRAIAYLPLWRFPNRATVSAFNGLANVWVTARMVKASGWGPWQ